jgi:MFS family permease
MNVNQDEKELLIPLLTTNNEEISTNHLFNLNICLEIISEKPIYQLRTLLMLLLTWGLVPIVIMLPYFFDEVPYLCSNKATQEPYIPCTQLTICSSDYFRLIDPAYNEVTWSSDFELICDRDYLKYLIGSAYFVGMIVSSFITPGLCDKFGKKKVLVSNMLLFVLNNLFVLTISDGAYLILFTFIAGYIYTGISIPAFVLNYEFYTPKTKNILSSIFGCSFPIGALLQILIFYVFRNWKYNIIISLVLYIIVLIFSYKIYESPNYLIRLSKREDLINCLNGVAEANCSVTQLNNYLSSVSLDHLFKNNKKEEHVKKYTLIDVFGSLENSTKIILISVSWFTCSMIAWGTSLNVRSYGSEMYFNSTCMYIAACLSIATSSRMLDVFGNNKTEIIYYLITIIANVGLSFSQNCLIKSLCVFLTSFCTNAIGSINYIYTAELFISELRVHSLAVGSLCNRIGGLMSPFVVGYFAHPPCLFFVLSFLTICGLLILNKQY